ncbi:MAG: hypothetical protein H7Z12_18610 [Rhodospirillaceae bacterium]|nr:hypothetical protein [Rhodospirillales bacterium]
MRHLIIALAGMIGFGWSQAAHADELWQFIKLDCIPEIQYFSLKSFHQSNLPSDYLFGGGADKQEERLAYLQKAYGLYGPQGLGIRPFKCVAPPRADAPGYRKTGQEITLEVTVTGPEGAYCGDPRGLTRVIVNGIDVGPIQIEGCWSGNDDVNIEAMGVAPGMIDISYCKTEASPSLRNGDSDFKPVRHECRRWEIRSNSVKK